MTFDPLAAAGFAIQIHVAFALVALLLGPVALFRRRRDRIHKIVGYVWIVGLIGLALSGLFIESEIAVFGHFGPIHLLCPYALWGVGSGLYWIRKGDRARHRAAMRSVWFGAVGVAGLFTLMPGRILNRMLFGEPSLLGLALIAGGAVGLYLLAGAPRPSFLRTSRG